MKKQMLACGHAVNARDKHGNPTCAICIGIDAGASTVVHTPSLSGRTARCAYGCGSEKPSDTDLAFFEYQGPGSEKARRECKNCGRYDTAHGKGHQRVCSDFQAVGDTGKDMYYCGCKGWD